MTVEEFHAQMAKVRHIVGRKLIEFGGMENGYQTGASGWIKKTHNGVYQQIDFIWQYDQRRQLTLAEIDVKAHELAVAAIGVIVPEFWNIFDRIILRAECIEDGCYHTKISAQSHDGVVQLWGTRERLEDEGVLPVPDHGDNGFAPAGG